MKISISKTKEAINKKIKEKIEDNQNFMNDFVHNTETVPKEGTDAYNFVTDVFGEWTLAGMVQIRSCIAGLLADNPE